MPFFCKNYWPYFPILVHRKTKSAIMELSSTHRMNLPKPAELQTLCKALSVLEAIFSPEWEYRYYSYNNKWNEGQEFFQMRDGEGNEMLVLFTKSGVVINGFDHELYDYEAKLPAKSELTLNLPVHFNEFIFGEPVASIGTTYCLWTNEQEEWTVGNIKYKDDGSNDHLYIFDGNPMTYIDWVLSYYFDDELDNLSSEAIESVCNIYKGVPLTKEMVLSLNSDLEDWEELKSDISNIGYPITF